MSIGGGSGGGGTSPGSLVTRALLSAAEARGEQPEFIRNQYYGLEWRAGAGAGASDEDAEGERAREGEGEARGAGVLVADEDLHCELRLSRAGSFHYYFVYDTA